MRPFVDGDLDVSPEAPAAGGVRVVRAERRLELTGAGLDPHLVRHLFVHQNAHAALEMRGVEPAGVRPHPGDHGDMVHGDAGQAVAGDDDAVAAAEVDREAVDADGPLRLAVGEHVIKWQS